MSLRNVVTNTRLLVIRDDGHRVDSYRLADVSAIDASALPTTLAISFGQEHWSGSVSSHYAAIVFVYAILTSAGGELEDFEKSSVDIVPPAAYQTRNETVIAYQFLRGFGYEPDDQPGWVASFKKVMALDEVLLGLWDFADDDYDSLTLGITTEQLLISRAVESADRRLLPEEGAAAEVVQLPLASIDEVEDTAGDETQTLTILAANIVYSYKIIWLSGGTLEDFASDLRATIAFKNSGESTETCPADPLYWPAQALDLLVGASESIPEPDPSAGEPTYTDDGVPRGYPLLTMTVHERNSVLNRFALAYGLDLSPHADALESLWAYYWDESELLYCLTQSRDSSVSGRLLVALTSDWIYLLGESTDDVEPVPLGAARSVSGEVGRSSGTISIEYDQEKHVFASVPHASIDSFVAAANELRVGAAKRLEQLAIDSGVLDDSDDAEMLDVRDHGYVPTAIRDLPEEGRKAAYRRLATEVGDMQFLVRGELQSLPEVMMPGELLLWFASGVLWSTGKDEGKGGYTLIALTDRRILILDKRFLGGVQTISIDLDRINSISGDTGLIIGTGSVKIQDGGDERKIAWMDNSTIQPFVTRVQQAIEDRKQALAAQQASAIASATGQRPAPAPTAPADTPQVDVADQLEKLANLVDRGFLTLEEFAEQKAKLLNG